jgi:hypothetical protein
MKKINRLYFVLFALSVIHSPIFSQNKVDDLFNYFAFQQNKLDFVYNSKIGIQALQSKNSFTKYIDKAQVAALSDYYILYREEADIRANEAANIDFLQNGAIQGFQILGDGVEVAIFDGGKVLSTHDDFIRNGTSKIYDLESNVSLSQLPLSNHATAVSGFIVANGGASYSLGANVIPNATRGVIPHAKVYSAGYATTSNGNIFQKILSYNLPISNHSYGINFGWSRSSDATNNILDLYYAADPQYFINDRETYFGTYFQEDANYDYLVANNPQLSIVKSAGNYDGIGPEAYPQYTKRLYKYVTNPQTQQAGYVPFEANDIIPKANSFNGAYSIATGSLAKNIITVGAINLPNKNTNNQYKLDSNTIVKSSYSSVGPRKDGAIKPDLVTVGTGVVHAASTNNSAYNSGQGTSYSAPKVTGAIGALTHLQRKLTNNDNFYFEADQIKGLLLHTTIDAGPYPGPDNKYGWGALDAKHAAEVLVEVENGTAFFEKNEKTQGIDVIKTVSARANEPLKATLTWIDPPFTNISESPRDLLTDQSPRLINDLDIRIIDTETNEIYYPWKLDINNVTGPAIKGDNKVDNVEQILIETPIVGRNYKIIVSNKGQLVDINTTPTNKQWYSLLITGANDEVLSSDKQLVKDVVVYPTITDALVYINTDIEIHEIKVFDVTGKLIKNTTNKVIDMSNLSRGVYIINIITSKNIVVTKKVIKT